MIQEKANERVRILAFWEKHGTEATEEAFKVKERTLYLWQRKLKDGHGKLESLNDGNKAPKVKRKRLWDCRIIRKLMDYLVFYNTERVHHAFGNKLSPVEFMLQSPYYKLTGDQECKTGWP